MESPLLHEKFRGIDVYRRASGIAWEILAKERRELQETELHSKMKYRFMVEFFENRMFPRNANSESEPRYAEALAQLIVSDVEPEV